jgi:hypothetical protein
MAFYQSPFYDIDVFPSSFKVYNEVSRTSKSKERILYAKKVMID